MKNFTLIPVFAALFVITGCTPAQTPVVPAAPQSATQQSTASLSILPPADTQQQPPAADGKKVACNTDADCVPDPSTCHARTCVTKTEAEGMEAVQMCTMMFDYQAAYSPEDCACDLGKCVNKNLGRTGDAPIETVEVQ